LFSLVHSLSHDAFVKLAVTLWATWTARRKAIHEGILQSPNATHAFINRYLADLEIVKEQQQGMSRTTTHSTAPSGSVRPKAPPAEFAKIHVDAGVSKRHRRGAAVAVCRDERGNYLGSSTLVVEGMQDAAVLECMARREALALAEDLAVGNFIVASDAKQVVQDISSNSKGSYGMIISEIKSRVLGFNCNIVFEGRWSNRDAHSLAKFSLSLALGCHMWLDHSHNPLCIPQTVVFDE
jgi:ribonuclease HI